MEGECYEFDPSGDVVLTLHNPNAPFAVWNEVEAQNTSHPSAEVTAQNITESTKPRMITGGREPKIKKNKRTEGTNMLPATTAAEPMMEPTRAPETEPFVEVPAESGPEIESIADISTPPESAAEDTPTASEPASLASMPCSTPLPRADQPWNQAGIRMRLSSSHLSLASPIFKKMLLGSGRESTCVSGSGHLIDAEGWDDDALRILMHIIHGRTRSVPRSVDLETLAKIAVLVEYYECHEVVEIVTSMWIDQLKGRLPQEYCRDLVLWCLISWVFSQADLFQAATQIAVNKCQGPLPTLDLPIPEMLVDAIDRKRRTSIDRIIIDLQNLLSDLREDREGCSFECSSILLGALTKEMGRKQLLDATPGSPLLGFSLEATAKAKLDFRSPRWSPIPPHSAFGTPSKHSCNLRSLIVWKVGVSESLIDGITLDSFPEKKAIL
ncbi:hypothetical protein PG994_015396, partial [Apiospora phragmitis]